MSVHLWCAAQLVFALCINWPFATHSQNSTSNQSEPSRPVSTDPDEYPFTFTDNPATAAYDPTSASTGPLETVTPENVSTVTPDNVSMTTSEANVTWSSTDGTTLPTVFPSDATIEPIITPDECLCDVTSDFCDIGCCCDIVDCDILDLSSVFNGCREEIRSGMCIESWLMFRANVDPDLITATDNLFCVREEEDSRAGERTLPALSETPSTLLLSPHFPGHGHPVPAGSPTWPLYRVDDVILTYYNSTSVLSVLRQPSPGAAASSCVDRNPARFLRSESLSCSRSVSVQTCQQDPSLNARSYSTGFSLLRVPVKTDMSDLMIPIIPLSDWPEPSQWEGSCLNVVSKVEYLVEFTSGGEITTATVNVALANTSLATELLQQHTLRFQLNTDFPLRAPSPLVGLKVGTPVIGRFGDVVQPLTVLGVSQGGECSADPLARSPILFTRNAITGCTFSSASRDCAAVRAELYRILEGVATPDLVAMNSGTGPDWTRVIKQDCPGMPADSCEVGCVLPLSLSVQVLWARRGLLALPQNHVLGAKYRYSCQREKCPVVSPLVVTSEVTFSDATVYPESPRGEPQPDWKFPFAFFTRGAEERDGVE